MRVFVYTVHKAGSMFLHRLLKDMARYFVLPHHSMNDERTRALIKETSWCEYFEAHRGAGIFGPIRVNEGDPCDPPTAADSTLIVHVRDPRDVLTSLFYSHAYSHKRRLGGFDPSEAERERWRVEGNRRICAKIHRSVSAAL
jgi:hypothetical protein